MIGKRGLGSWVVGAAGIVLLASLMGAAGDTRTSHVQKVQLEDTDGDVAGIAAGALSATVGGPAAHGAPITGSPVVSGAHVRTTVPTAEVADDVTDNIADPYGHLFIRNDHLNRIRCTVTVSTATTIQAVGGACAAPGAGLSLYITDILFASNAQAIAADAFPTLKYGTGGTCGAGTAVFWGAFATAATQASIIQALATPIKIPANNEICWINTTAGSKFIVISGFIAP